MSRRGARNSKDEFWATLEKLADRKMRAKNRINAISRLRQSISRGSFQGLLNDPSTIPRALPLLIQATSDPSFNINYQASMVLGHFAVVQPSLPVLEAYLSNMARVLVRLNPSKLTPALDSLQEFLDRSGDKLSQKKRLSVIVAALMHALAGVLESSVDLGAAVTVVGLISRLQSKAPPQTFSSLLENTVDIILGWAVSDPSPPQPARDKLLRGLKSLESWSEHWSLASSLIQKLLVRLIAILDTGKVDSELKGLNTSFKSVRGLTASVRAIMEGIAAHPPARRDFSVENSISTAMGKLSESIGTSLAAIRKRPIRGSIPWMCDVSNIIRAYTKAVSPSLPTAQSLANALTTMLSPPPLVTLLLPTLSALVDLRRKVPMVSVDLLGSEDRILDSEDRRQGSKAGRLGSMVGRILRELREGERKEPSDLYSILTAEAENEEMRKRDIDACLDNIQRLLKANQIGPQVSRFQEIILALSALSHPVLTDALSEEWKDERLYNANNIRTSALGQRCLRILRQLDSIWPTSWSKLSDPGSRVKVSKLDIILAQIVTPAKSPRLTHPIVAQTLVESFEWLAELVPGIKRPSDTTLTLVTLSLARALTHPFSLVRLAAAKAVKSLLATLSLEVTLKPVGVLLAHVTNVFRRDTNTQVSHILSLSSSSVLTLFLPSEPLHIFRLWRQAQESVRLSMSSGSADLPLAIKYADLSFLPGIGTKALRTPETQTRVVGTQEFLCSEGIEVARGMMISGLLRSFKADQFQRVLHTLANPSPKPNPAHSSDKKNPSQNHPDSSRKPPDENLSTEFWENVLGLSHPLESCEEHKLVRERACGDRSIGEAWLCAEMGKYFVATRLNTPLGGPMASLSMFEKLFSLCLNTINSERKGVDSQYLTAIHASLFLERLVFIVEKIIAAAKDGTMDAPLPDPSISTFFTANARVVASLFERARVQSISLAGATGVSPEILSLSGPLLLNYLKARIAAVSGSGATAKKTQQERLVKAFQSARLHVCRALCSLRDSHSLRAIRALSLPTPLIPSHVPQTPSPSPLPLQRFSNLLKQLSAGDNIQLSSYKSDSWITGMSLEAGGELEAALGYYAGAAYTALIPGVGDCSHDLGVALKGIDSCLLALNDFEMLKMFHQNLPSDQMEGIPKEVSRVLNEVLESVERSRVFAEGLAMFDKGLDRAEAGIGGREEFSQASSCLQHLLSLPPSKSLPLSASSVALFHVHALLKALNLDSTPQNATSLPELLASFSPSSILEEIVSSGCVELHKCEASLKARTSALVAATCFSAARARATQPLRHILLRHSPKFELESLKFINLAPEILDPDRLHTLRMLRVLSLPHKVPSHQQNLAGVPRLILAVAHTARLRGNKKLAVRLLSKSRFQSTSPGLQGSDPGFKLWWDCERAMGEAKSGLEAEGRLLKIILTDDKSIDHCEDHEVEHLFVSAAGACERGIEENLERDSVENTRLRERYYLSSAAARLKKRGKIWFLFSDWCLKRAQEMMGGSLTWDYVTERTSWEWDEHLGKELLTEVRSNLAAWEAVENLSVALDLAYQEKEKDQKDGSRNERKSRIRECGKLGKEQSDSIIPALKVLTTCIMSTISTWFSPPTSLADRNQLTSMTSKNGNSKTATLPPPASEFGDANPDAAVPRILAFLLPKLESVLSSTGKFPTLCPKASVEIVPVLSRLSARLSFRRIRRIAALRRQAGNGLVKVLQLPGGRMGKLDSTVRLLTLLTSPARPLSKRIAIAVVEDTPPAAWSMLTPQVFARLGHSHPETRRRLDRLLQRISQTLPGHALFPALADLETLTTGSEDNGETEKDARRHQLERIVTSAGSERATLARRLVKGLNRIATLPEDRWIFLIRQLLADLPSRAKLFREQFGILEACAKGGGVKGGGTNGARNRALAEVFEVYSDVVRPLVIQMTELADKTIRGRPGSYTAHEEAFKAQFGIQILRMLHLLRFPPHLSAPSHEHKDTRDKNSQTASKAAGTIFMSAVWERLSTAAHKLKRELALSHILDLRKASPFLASWGEESEFLTPRTVLSYEGGVGVHVRGLAIAGMRPTISIETFEPNVEILATKTRPKKIEIRGTDGNPYRYLLKSQEDLRLDQRIMQLLRVTNQLLKSQYPDIRSRRASCDLQARTYHVLPLSHSSGLIQWVEGMKPLFDFYKKWQERAAIQMERKMEAKTPDSSTSVPESNKPMIPSPLDEWSRAVAVRTKEAGLKDGLNRSEVPQQVLRKALGDLVAKTPSDLIGRELIASTTSVAAAWRRRERFAASLGVMSIIGWMVGLGDRHLGNILLSSETGEVLHIDYGVIFDAGLRLPVPEIVPFRLTNTLEGALGPLGVNGAFRGACYVTCAAIRSHRSMILTLLEHAFVYDPLADWTKGGTAAAAAEERAWRDQRRELDGYAALRLLSRLTTAMLTQLLTTEKHLKSAWNQLNPLFLELDSLRPHPLSANSPRNHRDVELSTAEKLKIQRTTVKNLQRRLTALRVEAERLGPQLKRHKQRLSMLHSQAVAWINSKFKSLEPVLLHDAQALRRLKAAWAPQTTMSAALKALSAYRRTLASALTLVRRRGAPSGPSGDTWPSVSDFKAYFESTSGGQVLKLSGGAEGEWVSIEEVREWIGRVWGQRPARLGWGGERSGDKAKGLFKSVRDALEYMTSGSRLEVKGMNRENTGEACPLYRRVAEFLRRIRDSGELDERIGEVIRKAGEAAEAIDRMVEGLRHAAGRLCWVIAPTLSHPTTINRQPHPLLQASVTAVDEENGLCRFGPLSKNLMNALSFLSSLSARSGLVVEEGEGARSLSFSDDNKASQSRQAIRQRRRSLYTLADKFRAFVATRVPQGRVSDEHRQLQSLHDMVRSADALIRSTEQKLGSLAHSIALQKRRKRGGKEGWGEALVDPDVEAVGGGGPFLRVFFVGKTTLISSIAHLAFSPAASTKSPQPPSFHADIQTQASQTMHLLLTILTRYLKSQKHAGKVFKVSPGTPVPRAPESKQGVEKRANPYIWRELEDESSAVGCAYESSLLVSSGLEAEGARWLLGRGPAFSGSEDSISPRLIPPARLRIPSAGQLASREVLIPMLYACGQRLRGEVEAGMGVRGKETEKISQMASVASMCLSAASLEAARDAFIISRRRPLPNPNLTRFEKPTQRHSDSRAQTGANRDSSGFGVLRNEDSKSWGNPLDVQEFRERERLEIEMSKELATVEREWVTLQRIQKTLAYETANTHSLLREASNSASTSGDRREPRGRKPHPHRAWGDQPARKMKATKVEKKIRDLVRAKLASPAGSARSLISQVRPLVLLACRGKVSDAQKFRVASERFCTMLEEIVRTPSVKTWSKWGGEQIMTLQKEVFEQLRNLAHMHVLAGSTSRKRECSGHEGKSGSDGSDLRMYVEKRNKRALGILRKIRGRLKGRQSVGAEVDLLIREAISAKNLSQMYEGWAPWI